MIVWVVEDYEGVRGVYADEVKANADAEARHMAVALPFSVVDWDAQTEKVSAPPQFPDDTELFRPASLQSVVSQPSLTAAMTRAWLAWLAYNQPTTKVSGDELVDGKLVRSGETAAEAWSRLQHSESEREFLKLQSLVPAEPQR